MNTRLIAPLAALVLELAGCRGVTDADGGTGTDGGTSDALWASGARLKARALTSAGAGVLTHFRDTQLGLDCSFARDRTLARYRCFPTRSIPANEYLDAACTQPVMRWSDCAPTTGTLVSVESSERCTGRPTLLPMRVGASVSTATSYAKTSAGCERFDGAMTEYRRLDAVPDLDFVEATAVAEGSGAVGAETLVASDGTREVLGAWAFEQKARCVTMPFGEGQACAAADFAWAYGDFVERGRCSEAIGYSVSADACGPPRSLFKYEASDGGAHVLVGLFTAVPIDAGAVVVGNAAANTCSSTGAMGKFWRAGAQLPAPPAMEELRPGSGAAQPLYFGSGGRPLAFKGEWYDSSAQRDCLPRLTLDAGVRCLPDLAQLYFSDAACTALVAHSSTGSGPVLIVGPQMNSCGQTPVVGVRALGSRISDRAVYGQFESGCLELSGMMGDLYALGAEVPLSGFPELTPLED